VPERGRRAGSSALDDLDGALARFPDAVLTGRIADGGLLARLRSFAVRGHLLTDGAEWRFRPTATIAGLGMSGPIGDLRVFLAARRRAGRYLAVRALPRPRVPWRRLRSSS
jgi:hypothetical protein